MSEKASIARGRSRRAAYAQKKDDQGCGAEMVVAYAQYVLDRNLKANDLNLLLLRVFVRFLFVTDKLKQLSVFDQLSRD